MERIKIKKKNILEYYNSIKYTNILQLDCLKESKFQN